MNSRIPQHFIDELLQRADIVEIITHVAMNIFTNLLGKATQVDIDFPIVELKQAA